MSKHKQILFDWEPPPPGKDEATAVRKVVAEIERNVPGYTPPTPISADDRKDLSKSARSREREREAEHRAALEALEAAEKQLKDDHKRLARLAEEKEADQRREKSRQAEQEEQRRKMQRQHERDASERQRLSALEHEWRSFKAQAAQAQFAQRREAYFADLQRTVDDLGRMANPPPELLPSPDEDEPTGRLGSRTFDPELMKAPQRWR
jgi:chromosome segregation ATPase